MPQKLPFNVDALIVFVKVVEARSLSKAALALNMPKSTISRKISRLESDLGIKLLRKNTHQLSVTDLGQQVYSHSLKILAEANDIRALAEGSKKEPQGELKVAIPVFMGIDYASRVGTTFLQRYPKSQLNIQMVDHMAHPIRDGYDVVFGIGPLQDSTLIARKVFTLDFYLCASREFMEKLPDQITAPTEMNKLPFVDSDFYGSQHKLIMTKGKKSFELSPLVRARANSFQICKQYITEGLGIGVMPEQIIVSGSPREGGNLMPVLPDWSAGSVDIFMIYPWQLSYSNLISAFYTTALEIITQNREKLGGKSHDTPS